jgi:hypothetical protein
MNARWGKGRGVGRVLVWLFLWGFVFNWVGYEIIGICESMIDLLLSVLSLYT